VAYDSAKPTKQNSNTSFGQFLSPSEVKEPKYSEKEQKYRLFLLQRLESSRDVRESPRDEFNGMTYSQRYESNLKAGLSFTPPRKNPEDTQVVTGTTREKKLAIMAAVLNLNFQTTFKAFDKNNIEDLELGDAMTDCVERSNKIEMWEEKMIYAYDELVTQGDVFVEEIYVDETRIDKKRIKLSDVNEETFKDFDPEQSTKLVFSGCRRNILSGLQVYLGSIKVRDVKQQPYLFTKEILPFENAKAILGHLPRWENVPRYLIDTSGNGDDAHWGMNWRLTNELQKDQVEILRYQDKWNDEYQILANGVMMLPIRFPMPWEHGEYNITQGKLEPISAFFAYSKSYPDKTKLDQEILDEMYRLAVLKTQKSYMPPIANYSTNILNRSHFLPGKVINNLNKGDVETLGGDPGMYSMKPSEFEMIKMVKEFVSEKTVSDVFQGQQPAGNPTATEISTVTQQAKQRLGLIIFGFIQFHQNLDMLRLYNILENYTKPTGEKVGEISGKLENKFRTVTVNKEIDGRGQGLKKIEFTDNLASPAQLYDMEEGITRDEFGAPSMVQPPKQPQKITQISPLVLRSIPYNWFPESMPTEKETSYASRIRFEDSLVKATQLFGPQSVNQDYAKMRWAAMNKENPLYFFNQNSNAVPSLEEVQGISESNGTKALRGGIDQAVKQGQQA
jgi:hypothetical protein